MQFTTVAAILSLISAIVAAPAKETVPGSQSYNSGADPSQNSPFGPGFPGDSDGFPGHGSGGYAGNLQQGNICFCCPPDTGTPLSGFYPTFFCDLLTPSGTCPDPYNTAFTKKVCCIMNFIDGTSSCDNLGPAVTNGGADISLNGLSSSVNSLLGGVGTAVNGLVGFGGKAGLLRRRRE